MSRKTAREPRLLSRDYIGGNETLLCTRRRLTEPYPLHTHEFFELELIVAGEGEQVLGGAVAPLSRGCLSILTPADLHAVTPRAGGLTYYNVMFSETLLADSAVWNALLSGEGRMLRLDQSEAVLLETLLSALADEATAAPFAEEARRDLLEYLLIRVLRRGGEGDGRTYTDAIRAALFFLQKHFREQITLSDAAEAAHLSPHYFSARFRKETGQGFHAYLTRLRLRYAHRLLAQGELPIMTVCYHTGFRSFSAFSRGFRAAYGVAPSEVRSGANR